MTTTSIRATAILTAALATVAVAAAPSPAATPTHAVSEPAAYAPGARLDVGGAGQLLLGAVSDEHVTITVLGVHVGGDGWSGGTLLIR